MQVYSTQNLGIEPGQSRFFRSGATNLFLGNNEAVNVSVGINRVTCDRTGGVVEDYTERDTIDPGDGHEPASMNQTRNHLGIHVIPYCHRVTGHVNSGRAEA